jgi:hypothetical protein
MKPIRGITGSAVIDDVMATPDPPPTTPAPSRPINRYTRFGQAMRRELAAHIPGQTADEREAMIKAATTPR